MFGKWSSPDTKMSCHKISFWRLDVMDQRRGGTDSNDTHYRNPWFLWIIVIRKWIIFHPYYIHFCLALKNEDCMYKSKQQAKIKKLLCTAQCTAYDKTSELFQQLMPPHDFSPF